MMKILKLFPFLVLSVAAFAQGPCFFQTAHQASRALYIDNAATHDDIRSGSVFGTQLQHVYQAYGNAGVVSDGPTFYITNPCIADRMSFRTADKNHLDLYNYHYVCNGGPYAGQGDTVAGSPSTAGGNCAAGTEVQYVNTYDIGVYCEGGGCVYGKLYASLGPTPYSSFFSIGPNAIGTLPFMQGTVLLPSGLYGILMGGNCDAGSSPTTKQGVGQTYCGELAGENGADTSNPLGGWNGIANEFFAHKVFTLPLGPGTSGNQHCMLYDPNHDNTIGLPASYTAYDNGGCGRVNSGMFMPNKGSSIAGSMLTNGAPHAADVVIWGAAQSVVFYHTKSQKSR